SRRRSTVRTPWTGGPMDDDARAGDGGAASGLPPTTVASNARRAHTTRRSNEEWDSRGLERSGLDRLLRERYGDYLTLRLLGDESRPLGVWTYLAPPEQR